MMKIKPLNKMVLVKISAPKEAEVGGIILPEKTKEALRRNCQGEVVAVGPELDEMQRRLVVEGDTVLFDEWSGTEVKVPKTSKKPLNDSNEEVIYKLVPYSNLLAIL